MLRELPTPLSLITQQYEGYPRRNSGVAKRDLPLCGQDRQLFQGKFGRLETRASLTSSTGSPSGLYMGGNQDCTTA